MGRAKVRHRRLQLAGAVERAAVVERPVICKGPLYLVHPATTAACAGSLQQIAALLRDESHPIATSALDAVQAFISDGASSFFGRDVASARREAALLEHLLESGQSMLPRGGRSIARRASAHHAVLRTPIAFALTTDPVRAWTCGQSARALPDAAAAVRLTVRSTG